MEQEVNMKIVCIACQSAKDVSHVFSHALKEYYDLHIRSSETSNVKMPKETHRETKGKLVKVKDLRKDGSEVQFTDMGADDLKQFRRYAKQYGVSYAMEKRNDTYPPTYLIFFKAKDGFVIDKAVSNYVTDTLINNDIKEGLHHKLDIAKDMVSKQTKKIRNKEHIR